jgi:hypothetical protein
MRKGKCSNGIAAVLVAAAMFNSCFLFEGDEEPPKKPAPAAKTYAVNVAETEKGVVTAPARAVPGSLVELQAAPKPVAAVAGSEDGSGSPPSLYVSSLSVTYGETGSLKNVPWKNNGTNKWLFVMPEGDVTVTAGFADKPAESTALSLPSVGSAHFTLPFSQSGNDYSVEIPHVFDKTPGGPTFFFNAKTEDPNAGVRITAESGGDDLFGKNIPLVEGETKYTVTVTAAADKKQDYTLTVSYEPDLTLGAVTLGTQDEIGKGWARSLAAAELAASNAIPVLWQTVLINAKPNADNAVLQITKTSNNGRTFEYGLFDFGTSSTSAVFDITVSRQVDLKEYKKTYPLHISRDCRADGGGVTIIKKDDVYYEVHTFTASGASSFAFRKDEPSLLGQVLVVAGGGGGGSRTSGYNDDGGGGGGGGVGYSEALALHGTTSITVGAGVEAGKTGNNSAFGSITVLGGGFGGAGYSTNDAACTGGDGGSSGGGGGGGGSAQGPAGAATPHGAVDGFKFYGNAGDKSDKNTAGGAGGSAHFVSDISGTRTEYGKGGASEGANDAANNIGAGGGGSNGNNLSGGKGGSGVVIIRFPAREPVTQ